MKHCERATIAIILLSILAPVFALAGVGHLGIYADDQGTTCELRDPGNSLITGYIVHKFGLPGDNATGCRFRIEVPAAATWMYLTFSTPFVPVGTANLDLSVDYGVCLETTTLIGSALWYSTTPCPPCGAIAMKPAPGFETMIATDCTFAEFPISGYNAVVNADASCCCDCWATRPSTWGSVKALYR